MTLRRRCTGTALYPHRVTWYDEVEGSCPTCAILAFARRFPRLTADQIATGEPEKYNSAQVGAAFHDEFAPKPTLREWLRSVWRSLWSRGAKR